MKRKNTEIYFWLVLIGSMFVGAIFGVYFLGEETNGNNTEIVMGITTGALIVLAIYLLRKKSKSNIPSTDERSIKIIQHYLVIVLYVLLFGSQAVLLILYFSGISIIKIDTLILCILGVFILIGIGATIVKRL